MHQMMQILVCRRDNPDVGFDRTLGTNRQIFKVSILIAKLSDLLDSSRTLFLKLTVSEIEFPTVTLASVAPSFLARSRQKEAFDFKYSSSLIMI